MPELAVPAYCMASYYERARSVAKQMARLPNRQEAAEMTGKAGSKRKATEGDRRTGADRRKLDTTPPGKVERRRSVESRQPDVVEIEMSPSEWRALKQELMPPSKQ